MAAADEKAALAFGYRVRQLLREVLSEQLLANGVIVEDESGKLAWSAEQAQEVLSALVAAQVLPRGGSAYAPVETKAGLVYSETVAMWHYDYNPKRPLAVQLCECLERGGTFLQTHRKRFGQGYYYTFDLSP